MNIKLEDMMRGAGTVINQCAQVKPGEKVLIIMDKEVELSIAQALASKAIEAGGDVVIAIMPKIYARGEPPSQISAAMKASDVFISITHRQTLMGTAARIEACEIGARYVSMTGIIPEMLVAGAITADFKHIAPSVRKFANLLSKAKAYHLTTLAGTDLRANIEGRIATPQTGIADERGKAIGAPCIEAWICPVESDTEGVIVVDATVTGLGLPDKPIKLRVENGRIVEISDGKAASELRKLLEEANDSNVYYVGELGFGLNPQARICGSIIEDEAVLGTAHVGIGNNYGMGGSNKASMHLDLVMLKPTLELDGKTIIRDGRYL